MQSRKCHDPQIVALQLVHEAIAKHAERGLPWALLTMLIDTSFPEESKATELRNAQHKAQSLATLSVDGSLPIESMPFLELESLLIDLHFGELALQTHSFTVKQPGIDTFKTQVNMCKAQAVAMLGDSETAISILKNVIRSCGVQFTFQLSELLLLRSTLFELLSIPGSLSGSCSPAWHLQGQGVQMK